MTTISKPMGSTLKPASLAIGALLAIALPWWAGDPYQLHLAALICVYWILIAGLNVVVGYTGQLSIGHVGLLAIGAYAFAILAGKFGWHPSVAVAAAGALGGLCGLGLGLPSLRLPGFYFAMATMAFALIVNELVLAQVNLTGGGIGLPGPSFPAPFDTPQGFYYLTAALALVVTLLSWNIARRMWGRGLMAVRDNPVTAQAVGVPLFRAKLVVFVFSGWRGGCAVRLAAELHHARHLRVRAEPVLLRLHHHRRARQHHRPVHRHGGAHGAAGTRGAARQAWPLLLRHAAAGGGVDRAGGHRPRVRADRRAAAPACRAARSDHA